MMIEYGMYEVYTKLNVIIVHIDEISYWQRR